jgi:hypothetical protein
LTRARQVLPAVLVMAASLPVAYAPLSAQDTEWNRYTLEELPGVFVTAEATEPCTGMGVESEAVRTRTLALLEEAEVQIMTESDMLAAPGLPDLRVTVECVRGDDDAAAYSVWVRMQQAARMVRDEQLQLSESVTWYTTALGVTSDSDLDGAVDEALESTIGQFAEAFKAANAEEETAN